MKQRQLLPLRLLDLAEVGRWMGCGRCSIMPCVVKWPQKETCWPGAAEWWSMKCHKGYSGEAHQENSNKFSRSNYFVINNYVHLTMEIIFFRALEEVRQAKGDMECSLYNAERRKKPATCIPKVQYSSHHSCICIASAYSFLFCSFSDLPPHLLEWSTYFTPALPPADQEKAAASCVPDALSSSPPSWEQESKSQQPT